MLALLPFSSDGCSEVDDGLLFLPRVCFVLGFPFRRGDLTTVDNRDFSVNLSLSLWKEDELPRVPSNKGIFSCCFVIPCLEDSGMEAPRRCFPAGDFLAVVGDASAGFLFTMEFRLAVVDGLVSASVVDFLRPLPRDVRLVIGVGDTGPSIVTVCW